MSLNISKYKIEGDSVWTELEGFEGAEFLIRRMASREVLRGRERILSEGQTKRKMTKDTLKDEELIDISLRLYSEYVLLDWRDIKEDGKDVAYSAEKAAEYLELVDGFHTAIQNFSTENQNFIGAEETAKKSGKPLSK